MLMAAALCTTAMSQDARCAPAPEVVAEASCRGSAAGPAVQVEPVR